MVGPSEAEAAGTYDRGARSVRVYDPILSTAVDLPLRDAPEELPAARNQVWAISAYVDHHRHLPRGGVDASERAEDVAQRVIEGIVEAEQAGVESFRDMGSSRALQAPQYGGRIVSAVRGIEGSHRPFAGRIGVVVRDRDDIQTVIHKNADLGARFVKLFATQSGLRHRDEAIEPALSAIQLREACAVADDLGLPAVAHCHGGPMARIAIDAGVTHLEHGLFLEKDDLLAMAERGVTLTLTVAIYLEKLGQPIRQRLGQLIADVLETGANFVVGTDGSRGDMAGEVMALTALGMDPTDALRGAVTPLSPTAPNHRVILLADDPRRQPGTLLTPLGTAVRGPDWLQFQASP